jgi:hypothetical protein
MEESEAVMSTTAEIEFEKIAAYGHCLEEVGKLLQNEDTTIAQLVAATFEGGLRIDLNVKELFKQ